MGSMEAILAEVVRARELVAMSPDDYPRETAAGFAIAARQAKDALPALEKEYVDALTGCSVTVAVVAPKAYADAFRKIAEDEGVELVADVRDLYGKIAMRVIPSMGPNREWTASQHSLALQTALSQAVDLGFKEMYCDNRAPFTSRVCLTDEEAIDAVNDTVVARLGDDLGRVYLRGLLTQKGVAAKIIPDHPVGVLVCGARTTGEAHELLKAWPSPSSVVTLSKMPTSQQVVAVFRNARKTLKAAAAASTPPEGQESQKNE